MSVFKINKNKNYTVISNVHLREKKMSLKAKGLLTVMLSLPENWDYSLRGLISICKENETAIKTTLKELKLFGYLRIDMLKPNKTKTGRIEYVYSIYEEPLPINKRQTVKKQKQQVDFQPTEIQSIENQQVENQVQLNTNTLNTKELNTNLLSIYNLLLESWNNLAKQSNLEQIKTITENRKKKINKLLENYTEEEVLSTMKKIKNIHYLLGKNESNWKIKFDDFLNEEKFLKIFENFYYDKPVKYQKKIEENTKKTLKNKNEIRKAF